jgi:predicted NBD/HSP70 family sugar kinase
MSDSPQFHGKAIVYDIGGTYFRSALWSDGRLSHVHRSASINYLNTPHNDPIELQFALVSFLVKKYELLTHLTGEALLPGVVSLGAPVDAFTQLVRQSGPLWGPKAQDFDLLAKLHEILPRTEWVVVNDVTSSLWYFKSTMDMSSTTKICIVTISTGIGSRTFDGARNGVPVDPVHGIQGEIGHLKVVPQFRGRNLHFTCDCGGMDHLNSISSGRGILNILRALPKMVPDRLSSTVLYDIDELDDDAVLTRFRDGLLGSDAVAIDVLESSVKPLAEILVTILTHDPLISKIVLIGGVVDGLGELYLRQLNRVVRDLGIFHILPIDPTYFSEKIIWALDSTDAGLLGAGYICQSLSSEEIIHRTT